MRDQCATYTREKERSFKGTDGTSYWERRTNGSLTRYWWGCKIVVTLGLVWLKVINGRFRFPKILPVSSFAIKFREIKKYHAKSYTWLFQAFYLFHCNFFLQSMKIKSNLNAVHWVNDDEIVIEFHEVTPRVTSRLILGDAMLGENRSSRRRYGIIQTL